MRPSTREAAEASKTTHQMVPGVGFVHHDAPPKVVVERAESTAACSPPDGAEDGSAHLLVAPGGRELPFIWIAAERAWERPGGHRMAFTAAYLGADGWRYSGPLKTTA